MIEIAGIAGKFTVHLSPVAILLIGFDRVASVFDDVRRGLCPVSRAKVNR